MNKINMNDSYGVFIPSSKKPLFTSNDLRGCDYFSQQGNSRSIFKLSTGQQCTQGGVIGVSLKEFLNK